MPTAALFIDLPNFYSHLLRSELEEPDVLRDYFLYWLDFDRLARQLTGESSPVWAFYSGRKLGPSEGRISGEHLQEYTERVNNLEGVTAYDVDIEGSQREHARYKCEKCKHEGQAQWESEKGIDASLTVHLFDTVDSWDVAYLLSGDADFVPAVRSLRRRGKIVAGAGFSGRSSALVRECYHYVDLSAVFLKDDLLGYQLFRQGGVGHFWLREAVRSAPDVVAGSAPARLMVNWRWRAKDAPSSPSGALARQRGSAEDYCLVVLKASGPIDLADRHEMASALCASYAENVMKVDVIGAEYWLTIPPAAWCGVEQRLKGFASVIDGLEIEDKDLSWCSYTMSYAYDHAAGEWRPVAR